MSEIITIRIKQAEEKDIPVLEEIYLEVVEWLTKINKPMWGKEKVSWKNGLSKEFSTEDFYIAYIDNTPAGCVALQDFAPFYWYEPVEKGEALFLRRLAVRRFAAGQGISKILMQYAADKCREKNIKALRLDTGTNREKLNKIYQDFGFICEKIETRNIGGKEFHISYYVYDII